MRFRGFACLGFAGAALLGGCTGSEGTSCSFDDPNLAAAVANEAQFEGLPESEMVSGSASGTTSLNGVQCLGRLESLSLSDAPLTDLSPLARHPTLTTLEAGTQATDLGPLGTIPHLVWVSLSGSFADLSPMAHLPELTTLEVSSDRLQSLAGLGSA